MLEISYGPLEDMKEQCKLENQLRFRYCQEPSFAMTICQLDISPIVIKLSQFSHIPSKYHYQVAKAVFIYLYYTTKYDGVYYWQPAPACKEDLPN
jgi:hypothetical protein